MNKAVFLDRDGTLIESVHYLNRPDQVRLLPQAPEMLCGLKQLGYLLILVTNQAVVGKGLLSVEGLGQIQLELERQLAAAGASVDAWYFCPVTRQSDDREKVEHPDRKPGPGMLLRAAREHDIDLARSYMIGDMLSDTLAGRNAGCRASILLATGLGDERLDDSALRQHHSVDCFARTPAEALAHVREAECGTGA